MISRVYLKDLISFHQAELELKNGLVVFSGPSGAGKSILMNAVLASFGYGVAKSKLCEISIDRPPRLKSEAYEFEDEIVIKSIKRDKIRYYLDGQNISKKSLNTLFKPFVQFLSIRDNSGFKSYELIDIIDSAIASKDRVFKKMLREYKKRYSNYKLKLKELKRVKSDELRLAELIEFATFEIDKIESINPKIGEDEELLKIKYQLSKIDKISDALVSANTIFECEEYVNEIYRLLDKDNSNFLEMLTQLRDDFNDIETLTEDLAEVNIEEVLDRLEKISYLKNRYGGIKEAIEYAELKRRELKGYKNIEQDKSFLESFLEMELNELSIIAKRISQARRGEVLILEKKLKKYLIELKLPTVKFIFDTISLGELGYDRVEIDLNGSRASTLSGGEFNRVRLALMVVALSNVKDGGVLILDEIDANVSGDESIAIANMISKLSSVYQIFAISHQAHLASKANQHILVAKKNGVTSQAILLDKKGRIDEIARIIGGEKPNQEAINFAIRLLKD
jgi:DNA repair protein RecN (Recombination protein N)